MALGVHIDPRPAFYSTTTGYNLYSSQKTGPGPRTGRKSHQQTGRQMGKKASNMTYQERCNLLVQY